MLRSTLSVGCISVALMSAISSQAAPLDTSYTYKAKNTCTGTYPSYWQDPAFPQMWEGQMISNVPSPQWKGPVFKLSDQYPRQPVNEPDQPWRASKFDALFDKNTDQPTRKQLAIEYSDLVMTYIQQGNVNRPGVEDWDVCNNPYRPWFSIPFQTYDAMSGREFTHGLTREAPVTFVTSVGNVSGTMWAVAFYNATAAYTLGQVWQADGTAKIPTEDMAFYEGAVIGKPLFTTLNAEQLPFLKNMPTWQANISNPEFCNCTPDKGDECTLVEESQQCPRSTKAWNDVALLQFDFAVKDSRAPDTQWVFGTYVADGMRKAKEADPWQRISLLGLMWGNDTPPKGQLAYNNPKDPKANGFQEAVIIWDTVNELNAYHSWNNYRQFPGHLGCNFRLNGPADNANSSCMSCHGTASVPDQNLETPPLLSQFSSMTKECVTPDANDPNKGIDRTGASATVVNNVSFSAMDGIYFANTPAGQPFQMMAQTPDGLINVMGEGVPSYEDSTRKNWISLDYSLQLSISLSQWMQWQNNKAARAEGRIHLKEIRRNQ